MKRALELLATQRLTCFLLLSLASSFVVFSFLDFKSCSVFCLVISLIWFYLLISLLTINASVFLIQRNARSSAPISFIALYLGFIVILAGSFVSGLFAVEGQMVLSEGEKADSIAKMREDKSALSLALSFSFSKRDLDHQLPFEISLLDVREMTDKKTGQALDFESHVEIFDKERKSNITGKTSLNRPYRYRSYSIFQYGYVPGSPEVSELLVKKDPGTPFVYSGFMSVLAGLALLVLLPDRKQQLL